MQGFFSRIISFFNDVRTELKKVSYPARGETIGSTTVVLILVVIIGLYLFIVDLIFVKAIRLIIQ